MPGRGVVTAVSALLLVATATGDSTATARRRTLRLHLPRLDTTALPDLRLPSLPSRTATDSNAFVVDATRSGDEWSLRVERDGVRVWRRSVPGSAHAEVRGNGLIRASPEQ
eukprot:3506141-Prymnesium_polylepis.1